LDRCHRAAAALSASEHFRKALASTITTGIATGALVAILWVTHGPVWHPAPMLVKR
jgi:hypothetical protein